MSDPADVGPNLLKQIVARQLQQRSPQGFQSHLFRERMRLAKNLYKFDLVAHYGCVNAIEFSNGGDFLASGGDDKRILIWDVEKAIAGIDKPRSLDSEHTSNVFCLGFDRFNRKVFSGGNDDLVIVHDNETGRLHNVYKHEKPVYGLAIDPTCDSVFATACEDGQILIFDQRNDPADPLVVAKYRASFHAVQFHPLGGNFLVTANSKRGAAFWDIRKPHSPVIQYGVDESYPSYMSVRFNNFGNLILALRRRLPPILYNTFSPEPICQFYHADYYNSCTMKSCTFGGEDDELVLSGSDDFNLYVWRVSDADLELTDQWIETTQMVLYGHRSIVNQVRYNREKCMLASSGVEKVVKLWSPFNQKDWSGALVEAAQCSDNPRDLFSPFTYPSLTPQSWSHMPHDYSSRNTNEDPRMMAFFDSLIQQEIEGWDTNNSSDSQLASEGSSRSANNSSIEDSDEQELLRYFVRKRERQRKNSMINKLKIQRHKYANRIAYLIATKRNTLRRLALKGASNSNRRPQRLNMGGRSSTHRMAASSRMASNSKRNGRGYYYGRHYDHGQGPSSSGMSSYRILRRKYKRSRGLPVNGTSSDDDDSTHLPNNHLNMAIPSTSTGITSSGKDAILRLRQQQQLVEDSDEDDDDEAIASAPAASDVNHIPIIPPRPVLKVNGFGHAHDDSPQSPPPVLPRNSVNRRRKAELDIYSSHSNSRLSNSSFLDETSSSSTDCNHHLSSKRRKFTNTTTNPVASEADSPTTCNNVNNNNSTDTTKTSSNSNTINNNPITAGTSSSYINSEATNNITSNTNDPQQSVHLLTPDSGISVAAITPQCNEPECRNPVRSPCDHSSGASNSSNNKITINLFQQKVSRVRRNYRKKFADESESD